MSCAWFFSYELNIILEIQVETTNHFTRSAPNGLLLGINHSGQITYSICTVSRNALASGSLGNRELALDG